MTQMKRLLKDTIMCCVIGSIVFGIAYRYMYLVTTGKIPFVNGKVYEPESYVKTDDTKK